MNSRIRNPQLKLLSQDIITYLGRFGELIELNFGKMRGFRIKYNVPNIHTREKILDYLKEKGILVTSHTETLNVCTGHLNINEIELIVVVKDSDVKTMADVMNEIQEERGLRNNK